MTTSAVTVLADQRLDLDQLMLDGVDTSSGPLFSVSEMAKVFFARTAYWVRWLENCEYPVSNPKVPDKTKPCGMHPLGHSKEEAEAHKGAWRMVLDGELLVPIRTESNARKYDLALIEKIAHALASNNTIEISQLRHALAIVHTQAQMNNYIA